MIISAFQMVCFLAIPQCLTIQDCVTIDKNVNFHLSNGNTALKSCNLPEFFDMIWRRMILIVENVQSPCYLPSK